MRTHAAIVYRCENATLFLVEHERSQVWTTSSYAIDLSQQSSSGAGCADAVLVGFTRNMWGEQMAVADSHQAMFAVEKGIWLYIISFI